MSIFRSNGQCIVRMKRIVTCLDASCTAAIVKSPFEWNASSAQSIVKCRQNGQCGTGFQPLGADGVGCFVSRAVSLSLPLRHWKRCSIGGAASCGISAGGCMPSWAFHPLDFRRLCAAIRGGAVSEGACVHPYRLPYRRVQFAGVRLAVCAAAAGGDGAGRVIHLHPTACAQPSPSAVMVKLPPAR